MVVCFKGEGNDSGIQSGDLLLERLFSLIEGGEKTLCANRIALDSRSVILQAVNLSTRFGGLLDGLGTLLLASGDNALSVLLVLIEGNQLKLKSFESLGEAGE